MLEKLRSWLANKLDPHHREYLEALTESQAKYESMASVACRIEEVRQAEVQVLAGIISALSLESPERLTISRELFELGKACAVRFEYLEDRPSRLAIVITPPEQES